jgi:hypothetical protein
MRPFVKQFIRFKITEVMHLQRIIFWVSLFGFLIFSAFFLLTNLL